MISESERKKIFKPNNELEKSPLNLSDIVSDVLDSDEIAGLQPDEQGRLVMDMFVGALIRHGDFVSSSGAVQEPIDIIKYVQKIQSEEDSRYITRTDGLRDTITRLAKDERTGPYFGRITESIVVDAEGRVTLTTPDQIAGYVYGADNHTHDPYGQTLPNTSWVPIILDEAVRGDWTNDPRGKDSLAASDNDTLRLQGNKIAEAQLKARLVGLDLDLLRRSSDYIRDHNDS